MNISKKSSNSKLKWLKQNSLLILTIGAVFIGILSGCIGRLGKPNINIIRLIGFPGELLMRMLKCIILPLISSSLITGLAHLDVHQSGRMGVLAILYYLITTGIAVTTGIILVIVIHPGNPDHYPGQQNNKNQTMNSVIDTILDLIRNIFPDNIIQSTMQQTQTKIEIINGTNGILIEKYKLINIDGINILGLIVFCIAFGTILSQLGQKGRLMVNFFAILDLISMKLVSLIMWYSPIGISSLIASKILSVENLNETANSLAMYCLTIIIGLSIHSLISLPLLYFFLTGKNPFIFAKGLLQAIAIAFGTASSAATLPATFRCLEQNLGIDKRVTRFVLPIGATINMDGTALYEAVATIFIAQMNGMEFGLIRIIIVSLTATLASIGAASVPHGGLVTVVVVLTAVGLPVGDVSLIVAVDWFIDRFRTSINVLGDAYGAAIVFNYCKDYLPLEKDELFDKQKELNELTENGHLLIEKEGINRKEENYDYLSINQV
ncbi:Amino acid transporter [Meloidogyne graminicola]|uniref:Amino acid transporter n=1 Tax=Meloidogyne graminicola TaxID=189291 RepID=A0A8S9ZMA0_9BILA|nr:Amino acid transporter [Meloidogyne graminicola]